MINDRSKINIKDKEFRDRLNEKFTRENPDKGGICEVIAQLPSGYILCSTWHRDVRKTIPNPFCGPRDYSYSTMAYSTGTHEALEAIDPETGKSIEIEVIVGYRGNPYRQYDSLEVTSVAKNGDIHYQRTYHPGMRLPGPQVPDSRKAFTVPDPGPKDNKYPNMFKEKYKTREEIEASIKVQKKEAMQLEKELADVKKEEEEGYIYQAKRCGHGR